MNDHPPRKIKILHQTWTIRVIPEKFSTSSNLGYCDNSQQRIALVDGQHPQCMRDTLYHEIQHALNYMLQLDKANDEDLATRSPAGWMTVFTSNPRLTRWFFGDIFTEK